MKKVLLGIGYWILQLTWGALLTIPGLLVTAFCILFLKGKPHRNGYSYIVEVGGDWGGLELGGVALCGRYSQDEDKSFFEHIRRHEFGHNLQNIILGPFFLFVIWIPSAIRYHYRNWRMSKGKEVKPYDAIWFEGWATNWGTKVIDKLEK